MILESCPDTFSCRSRQHLPYLGPCKPQGLQGPLGRFAVLRGAALRRVNGDPFAACAAQTHSASPSWLRRMPRVAAMATRATHASHPRASLPALSAVGTLFVRLTLYPGPRTGARDRTTLTCAAGGPASLRTQRRRARSNVNYPDLLESSRSFLSDEIPLVPRLSPKTSLNEVVHDDTPWWPDRRQFAASIGDQ